MPVRVGLDTTFPQRLASRTATSFTHDLADEPMLSLAAVAELAGRLGPASVSVERAHKDLVAHHDDTITSTSDVAEQIRALADNDRWFTLLNLERVEDYRRLVDRVVEGIATAGGMDATRLRRRMGFVFASSPHSVTSAHFDIEHSFLFQLAGERTLGVQPFDDEAHRRHEVERYWDGSFGRLEAVPTTEAVEFSIGPGTGVYIPPYTPHWLRNGASPSRSLTVTFFERSNERESMSQVFDTKLRRFGLHPRPYGERPAVDELKAGVVRTHRALKQALGQQETSASH